MSDLDLSGRWSGFYSYPDAALPPVQFEADLREAGGSITGTVREADSFTGAAIQAVLDGRRTARSVRFIKMYEDADENFDSVHYEGEVAPGGEEIAGRWHIPGAWSGAFLMVRAGGSKVQEVLTERVEAR